MMKFFFLFYVKGSFRFSDINFFYSFGHVGHLGKWLNKKAKINFKVNDVTDWMTNDYNIHIVQCLEK